MQHAPGVILPGAYCSWVLRRGLVVKVAAALGLPLPALSSLAVAALADAFDLGRGPLQAGPVLIGLDLGHAALVALGGLPAALAQPAGDHDPVPLGERVGQVLSLAAPDVDLQEAGVAVAPFAVLLDPLGDRHAQVGDGDAGVGESELGGKSSGTACLTCWVAVVVACLGL